MRKQTSEFLSADQTFEFFRLKYASSASTVWNIAMAIAFVLAAFFA
jgi:hypothetical protein